MVSLTSNIVPVLESPKQLLPKLILLLWKCLIKRDARLTVIFFFAHSVSITSGSGPYRLTIEQKDYLYENAQLFF